MLTALFRRIHNATKISNVFGGCQQITRRRDKRRCCGYSAICGLSALVSVQSLENRLLLSGTPGVPQITGPPAVLNREPVLSWDTLGDAESYEVWLANKSTGTNPVLQTSVSAPSAEFNGNPYLAVSDIDVSGGIAMSRVTGTTPMFLQASASNILATGTNRPYEDLEYSWDFGDASGVESLLNPATNKLVNPNTSQIGAEAAYVYRNPGTYTITLTARGRNAAGQYISATSTSEITVTKHVATANRYFDSVNGNDANDGLSAATAKRTMATTDFWPEVGVNTEYHFARGGVYDYNSGFRDGLRISAYGSGAKPVLRLTGQEGLFINIGSPNQHCENVVISDVELKNIGTGRTLFMNISNGEGTYIRDFYLDNVLMTKDTQFSNESFTAIQLSGNTWNFGLWNTVTDAGSNFTTGEYLGGSSGEWRFFVGGAMKGGVGDVAAKGRQIGHNIYTGEENHMMVRYMSIGSGSVDRYFCINGNTNGPVGSVVRYIYVGDTELTGMWGAIDLSNEYNSRTMNGVLDDIVIERNYIHDMSSFGNWQYPNGGSQVVFSYSSEDSTFRNNIFANLPDANNIFGWGDPLAKPRIYDNLMPSIPSLPVGGGGFQTNNNNSKPNVRYTPDTSLGIGVYQLWVRAENGYGKSAWSPQYNFRITTPVAMTPMSRVQKTNRPTISWDVLPGAVKYDIWISNPRAGFDPYLRNQDITATSFTPSSDMPLGLYQVWVRGIAADGLAGSWSRMTEFSVEKAPMINPGNPSTYDRTPEFAWSAVTGAVTYTVYLRNLATGATTYNQSNITATNWTPPSDLIIGPYSLWVAATGAHDVRKIWSASRDIHVGGVASLLTPGGIVNSSTPTFSWQAIDGAVRYELWVKNLNSNTRSVYETNLTATSFTSSNPLSSASYRVWIRAVSNAGEFSKWSAAVDFTIANETSPDGDLLQSVNQTLARLTIDSTRVLSELPSSASRQAMEKPYPSARMLKQDDAVSTVDSRGTLTQTIQDPPSLSSPDIFQTDLERLWQSAADLLTNLNINSSDKRPTKSRQI
jgi:hypothetical protein